MKIPRPVVRGLFLATVVASALFSSRVWPIQSTQAATNPLKPATIVTVGEPADRTPEIYQGTFTETSVQQILKDKGVTVDPADKVFAFPNPALGLGSQVKVYRASVVQITDANVPRTVHTWAKTVGDLAIEQNFQLAQQDIITPPLTTPIPTNGTILQITITRVTEANLDIITPIPFTTSYVDDANLDLGVQQVQTAGVDGKLDTTYLVHRENGIETSREEVSTKTVQAPVNQIIDKGTKVVSYGTGTASWYDLGEPPMSAATQSNIPKGTILIVTNLANGKSVTVTVDDRIGRADRIIDLSPDAFAAIGALATGTIQVSLIKAPATQ